MNELFSLEGQIAFVTGVQGRLGPVWSEGLLGAGATVVGFDLPKSKRSRSFSALQERFGSKRLVLLEGDICDRNSLIEALDRCANDVGLPSILVNNAGIDQPPQSLESYRLEDIPFEVCRDIFSVNALGAFQVTQVFGAEMIKAKRGSIINIGSLYAKVSPDARFYDHLGGEIPFLKPPAYGASKAALINFTKYFATHWGPYGVRVNTLSPGGVLGDQDDKFKKKFCDRVPMGRMATHEDLLGPIVFLASDASKYMTGEEINVDGGFTVW